MITQVAKMLIATPQSVCQPLAYSFWNILSFISFFPPPLAKLDTGHEGLQNFKAVCHLEQKYLQNLSLASFLEVYSLGKKTHPMLHKDHLSSTHGTPAKT